MSDARGRSETGEDDLLLAGDVGGSKTALALVSPARGTDEMLAEATFASRPDRSLEDLIEEFLADHSGRVRTASISVAGPVLDGTARLSNLPWVLNEGDIAERLGLSSVRLLNDLQATAYALPDLAPENSLTLQAGVPRDDAARAIIAPGTGLGEAFLLPTPTRFRAYPSEGGNTDFAPADEVQADLLEYLWRRGEGHVSYEDVCSGRGIPNIYGYLRERGKHDEPAWLTARLAEVDDPTPVIADAALRHTPAVPICLEALRIFVSILAAEAGNLALRVLATGGVYIGGGIPPRILSLLKDDAFIEIFARKGHFADLLSRVPVYVILDPRTALLGAAQFGLDLRAQPASTKPRAHMSAVP